MLMKTLEWFEKCKYDDQAHVPVFTYSKKARASAQSPKHRVRTSFKHPPTDPGVSNHQVSDDKISFATRLFDMSDVQDFQEECIILDQQNLAKEIQGLCTETPAGNSKIPLNNERLLDNISEELFSKEELGTHVSE